MVRIKRSNRWGGGVRPLALLTAYLLTLGVSLPGEITQQTIAKRYGSLRMHFERSPGEGFVGRGSGYNVLLNAFGATLSLHGAGQPVQVRITLAGTQGNLVPHGDGDRSGRSHYIHGNNPEHWRTDVRHYDRVLYRDVYPGIDWVFYGSGRRLEYDFVAEAGSDPGRIEFRLEGAGKVRLEGERIVADVDGEALELLAPKAFQRIEGETVEVGAEYRMASNGNIAFQLGEYDRRHALVIDPVVSYATYLGGSGADIISDIAVDSRGRAVVTGSTRSVDFPVTPGAEQETPAAGDCAGGLTTAPCFDAFVARLSADGSRLLHATYFGGKGDDKASAVAVNDNSIVVTGSTWAPDFPVTPGAFQQTRKGATDADAFVLRLDESGALAYATRLGGSDVEEGVDTALDDDDNAYIVGHTESNDFPVVGGLQRENRSDGSVAKADLFVVKLHADGSAAYATYLGGSLDERAGAIGTDAEGAAYVTGSTGSADFPTTASTPQNETAGSADAFVLKLNAAGSRTVYSTFVGGSDDEAGQAMSVDAAGAVTLVGSTKSADFPTTPGVIAPRIAQPTGFAAKLNAAGSRWLFATYLVGTADDLAVADNGEFYVTGTIGSSSPIFGGPEVPACNGTILRKLNPSATRLLFSGFQEGLGAIAIGADGALYSGATTARGGLATTPGAFQASPQGRADGYVMKLLDDGAEPVSVTCVSHGASFAAGPVAPGLIVSVFGSGLGPKTPVGLVLNGNVVSSSVADTQVLFDGTPAPLLYVHWNQINAVAPYSIADKRTVSVEVRRNNVTSAAFELPVGEANPGLFTRNGVGRGPAAILNEDGTINTIDNPAPRGTVVSLFGTGEGQTDPPGIDGLVTSASGALPRPTGSVVVEIGSGVVPAEFVGAAPELVAGVMQINVRIPAGSRTGLVPLRVTIGGRFTRQPLFVAVE